MRDCVALRGRPRLGEAEVALSEGSELHVCVDGQQRMRARHSRRQQAPTQQQRVAANKRALLLRCEARVVLRAVEQLLQCLRRGSRLALTRLDKRQVA